MKAELSELLHSEVSLTPVGGGCINSAFHLRTNSDQWFLKWSNGDHAKPMFKAEQFGLKLLSQHYPKVPEVVDLLPLCGGYGLRMEYLQQAPASATHDERFGQALAELHRFTSEKFGLSQSNYIGSLEQRNLMSTNWATFYWSERLEPQIKMALSSNLLDKDEAIRLEQMIPVIEDFSKGSSPSLLHGDLWSGNYMHVASGTAIFDPAVYFGFREMELAFTQMFGGFGTSFYSAYQATWPLDYGYEQRQPVWLLYPLLVHLNLFGRSYWQQLREILKRY